MYIVNLHIIKQNKNYSIYILQFESPPSQRRHPHSPEKSTHILITTASPPSVQKAHPHTPHNYYRPSPLNLSSSPSPFVSQFSSFLYPVIVVYFSLPHLGGDSGLCKSRSYPFLSLGCRFEGELARRDQFTDLVHCHFKVLVDC